VAHRARQLGNLLSGRRFPVIAHLRSATGRGTTLTGATSSRSDPHHHSGV